VYGHYTVVTGGELIKKARGSISAAVVDEDDLGSYVRLRERLGQPLVEMGQAVFLVVDGSDDGHGPGAAIG
jgi:hypothetical protein